MHPRGDNQGRQNGNDEVAPKTPVERSDVSQLLFSFIQAPNVFGFRNLSCGGPI
jgi:hypothetical protein